MLSRERWGKFAPGLILLILSASIASAEQVRIIESDGDAAQIRVDLVRQAREQVDVAYFIYDDDEAGLVGFYLLREAARSGRTVRLLVDWQWNQVALPMMRYLTTEGIQIRLYHPFHLFKPLRWTRRMHDKLVLVDGEHLLLGGRNIENVYFGFGERQYLDRDIYVHGNVAQVAQIYFDDRWNRDHGDDPGLGEPTTLELDTLRARIDGAPDILAKLRIVDLDRPRDWSSEGRVVNDVRFLHDTLIGKRKSPGIAADLELVLGATRREIAIESPYLVLTRGTRRLFQDLVNRGVHVRILTNSLKSTDNVLAQAGYVGHRKELVRMGVELWEYTGPRSMHSKSAVYDGHVSMVGTYNLDPRSERLNSEIAMIVDDPEVAGELRQSMDRNLQRAWRIGPNGKPEGQRDRYPGVSAGKKWKLWLCRLIEPFVRRQL